MQETIVKENEESGAESETIGMAYINMGFERGEPIEKIIEKNEKELSEKKMIRRRNEIWKMLSSPFSILVSRFNGISGATKVLKNLSAFILISFSIWGITYILYDKQALPGKSLFALGLLELISIFLGHVFDYFGLPPLLGMLISGLALRNVPCINYGKDLKWEISSPLRAISVVVLLSRGGFSVNPAIIKKYVTVIPQLAVFACIIESIGASAAFYLILDFKIAWAVLMGTIVAAMSSVCVMPFLNNIEKHENIPEKRSIVISKTGCGLDAILCICMGEFALGFIFSNDEYYLGLQKGFLEVIIGGLLGLIWGGICGLTLDDNNNPLTRTIVVLAGGIFALLGQTKFGYPRGGPIGCFINAFIASSIWRIRKVDGKNNDSLNRNFTFLWDYFQPLLFGIMGSRIDFATVDWSLILLALLCIIISSMIRIISVLLLTSCGGLTLRERIFISFAWLPKGTVQAALGPIAMETADGFGLFNIRNGIGYSVMYISVLTIVFGSLLGPLPLRFFGPKLLRFSHAELL